MTKPPRRQQLGFFLTPPHRCGYIPGRNAVTVFVDPRMRPTLATYSLLSQHGFRRSGDHVYRPKCPECAACVPVRIPVRDFLPRRMHRRTLRRNEDISITIREPVFQQEHFRLYERYLAARHAGGSMENPDPDGYLEFLTSSWSETQFCELRAGSQLMAVAVIDRLEDGLSAVYTFFDPDLPERSLGRYAILRQIELARAEGLDWLYLGYWIEDCRKMAYKTEFEPLEYYVDGQWLGVRPLNSSAVEASDPSI